MKHIFNWTSFRKRKNTSFYNDVPEILNSVEEEIERQLDAKAAKSNLTVANVKNILKVCIWRCLLTCKYFQLCDTYSFIYCRESKIIIQILTTRNKCTIFTVYVYFAFELSLNQTQAWNTFLSLLNRFQNHNKWTTIALSVNGVQDSKHSLVCHHFFLFCFWFFHTCKTVNDALYTRSAQM